MGIKYRSVPYPAAAVLALLMTIFTLAANAVSPDGKIDTANRKSKAESKNPFPRSTPESVGLASAGLELLSRDVAQLVADESFVGGELLVIKNRRTVLHESFGWMDREQKKPMVTDAVYCVRSMTKPFVGTAIQMLIDEEKFELVTPVHQIIPSFARPQKDLITIEHLLTHTSGLPFAVLTGGLHRYGDLAEVAALAAEAELLFEPGSGFEYSDAGSDVLGAVVAKITQMPVEDFIQKRILDPLGMSDTIPLLDRQPTIRERIPAAYSGGTGAWSKHWEPTDPAIFPLFLPSQSLYTTTTDYARFLALWMDTGMNGSDRLLSTAAVSRSLAPGKLIPDYPVIEEGQELRYGHQWMLSCRPDAAASSRMEVFGHSGSDGTHAWAWPELDLMVLFFTQSRGTLSGFAIERSIRDCLINGTSAASRVSVNSTAGLEEFAGLYWDEDSAHSYYVVTPQGTGLELDRPGRFHMVFKAEEDEGHFVHEARSDIRIEFERSDTGEVEAMRTLFGKRTERNRRHSSPTGLPSVAEIVEKVRVAHRIDRLPEVGVVKLSGSMEFSDLGMKGSLQSVFDESRSRTEIAVGSNRETIVTNADRAWSQNTTTGVDELEGRSRQQALLGHLGVLLGDWRKYYHRVEVLARVDFGGTPLLMVRVVPEDEAGSTLFVEEDTGLVIRKDDLQAIPGLGIVGVQTMFGDYRDIGGMQVPFKTKSLFQNRMIGTIVTMYDAVEISASVAAEVFAPLK